MKKSLLGAVLFFASLGMSAQTTILTDNFDSYTPGMGVAEQSDSWDTWDGSSTYDGEVSSDFASSGANSAKIQGTGVDLVLPVGVYTTGKYDVKFKMYIPTGGGGAYFNAMHTWSSTSTNYQWAVDVFFSSTGAATWTAGGTDGGGVTVPLDTWFDVQVTADMDNDIGKLYLNGAAAVEWQWSLNNANGSAGTNQIAAIDFYGTNNLQGEGLYYVDDVQIIESTGVGVNEATTSTEPIVFPNPANDQVSITLNDMWVGGKLRVMDMMGREVMIQNITRENLSQKVDVSALNQGVYLVKVTNGKEAYTTKLVIRK